MCGCVQQWAANAVAVPNTCPCPRSLGETASISVLPQGLADAALGELILAHHAPGIDPQEHIHAVPRPLGYLGRVDAAVEPCGQAGVPEVVRAQGERRGLLRGAQSRSRRMPQIRAAPLVADADLDWSRLLLGASPRFKPARRTGRAIR
jgi:hypothetical protein